jgi:hypothetical protein
MRSKIALLSGCLIATLCTTANSEQMLPDIPAVSPYYNITFYAEPNLKAGSTICFTFTKTGGVLGYADSCTFTSSISSGTWYQDGDEIVIWGGSPSNDSEAIPMIGKNVGGGRISGRFVDWLADGSSDGDYGAGNFYGVKTSGCSADQPGAHPRGQLQTR